jgi:hypothetical protein
MRFGDWAIIIATFFGPIAAVQIQKWLDRRGEVNRRQVEVFRTLMASRVTANSPQHVNALNAIPLEFHKVESVLLAWSDLLLHLNTDGRANFDEWNRTRITRFTALLLAMGKHLHYKFREAEIQDRAYFPEWQVALQNDQDLLRKALIGLASGTGSLNMKVTEFPGDPDVIRRTNELQALLIEWLEGKRTPTVMAKQSNATPK